MEIFILIAELGLPIAGALIMGFFIFTILKQMMNELIDEVKTIQGITKMLICRADAKKRLYVIPEEVMIQFAKDMGWMLGFKATETETDIEGVKEDE